MRTLLALLLAVLALPAPPRESVVPNDNRAAGGAVRAGVRELRLVARHATWRPDSGVDSTVTVQAFAEEGGAPRIPGPLLRATSGGEVNLTVRNAMPDSTLVVHGLRAGAAVDDTVQVAPGATRALRFRAGAPGTYAYWGTTTRARTIGDRPWRDSQLTGAIVIDVPGARPDPAERVFVVTVLDIYPDDTVHNRRKEDVWEVAINGRSWPYTERLSYTVGDTVRWRWVNGSYLAHPIHLHGFHFRVRAKGTNARDTIYAPDATRMAVTELLVPGATFRMDWVPTRAGRWLAHCHMIGHIAPFPERPDSVIAHEAHDAREPDRHPLTAMSGLVLGVTTTERAGAARAAPVSAAIPAPARRLRLLAQQRPGRPRSSPHGFVLQQGAPPRADSVQVPGPTLLLTRGETTAITVVNRLREPTTVHWHGLEIESVYDGVAGWGRTGARVAPLVAPGDSFTVSITPPRAGTYIYHTHMDEGIQLRTGMYGALVVLEPGERFDPATDLLFVLGGVATDSVAPALNGRRDPPPLTLRAGTRYRLRLVNILPEASALVELRVDSVPVTWRALAKDGATLPPAARTVRPARLRWLGVGETYDFEWTPARAGDLVLEASMEEGTVRQTIRVR